MVGNKMLVAVDIVRLRNRRGELETVLRHMRTRTTTAPRELLPILPAHEADATISEVWALPASSSGLYSRNCLHGLRH